MRYRALGKTGVTISEVGFGAWGIGGSDWGGARDEESLSALHTAIDAGVNIIDTALAYGDGHSEALIGQVVRARRERVFVATKIPPLHTTFPTRWVSAEQAFPPEHIVACTERSLRNLKRDCIDLQQLHFWRDTWIEEDGWFEALRKLKEAGKIRWVGVSLRHHAPESALRLVNSGLIDTVQVIYNIFDQSPAEALFPACLEHKVGVLVRCPFDEGGLTGSITTASAFPSGDFRSSYFAGERKTQLVSRINSLQKLLGTEARTLPELALRFCLAHPAVSTVLAGMRSQQHATENCGFSDNRRLRTELLQELKAHAWMRNFYERVPSGFLGRAKWLIKRLIRY